MRILILIFLLLTGCTPQTQPRTPMTKNKRSAEFQVDIFRKTVDILDRCQFDEFESTQALLLKTEQRLRTNQHTTESNETIGNFVIYFHESFEHHKHPKSEIFNDVLWTEGCNAISMGVASIRKDWRQDGGSKSL